MPGPVFRVSDLTGLVQGSLVISLCVLDLRPPCLNLLAFVRGGLRDLANMTFHRPFTVRSHLIEFIMMGHGLVTLASYLLSLVNSGLQCPELPARLLF